MRSALARKVQLRLGLPAIAFLLLSSLDRAAVAFAAPQMNHALGFSPREYGLGAGILFVGFLAGQYPSVLLFQRVGMRRWIAACALLWGASAAAMAFMHTTAQFYVLRVILGLAEGGLAPGIVLYLSQFASERERASTFALPMLAIPASIVIGGPLAGWLMATGNPFELPGWRWMLLVVAIPTIVLAVRGAGLLPRPAVRCALADGGGAGLARGERRHPARQRSTQRLDGAAAPRRVDLGAAVVLPAVRRLRDHLLAAADRALADGRRSR